MTYDRSKVSKTPWVPGNEGMIMCDEGGLICFSDYAERKPMEVEGFVSRDDEAFAIHAANNHDDLVAALEKAQPYITALGKKDSFTDPDIGLSNLESLIKRTLSRAKGTTEGL